MRDFEQIKKKIEKNGQEHILAFFDELTEQQKMDFLSQLSDINFDNLNFLVKKNVLNDDSSDEILSKEQLSRLKPPTIIQRPESGRDPQKFDEARKIGKKALMSGKVAAFVVAGGQGSRLGFDGPKGLYRISPIKKKSLFQIFAEKIIFARNKYKQNIPWLIMTSKTNHQQTVDFFREHDFFTLPEKDVIFFSQAMLPTVDYQGKLLLAEKDSLALAPNGHGGSLSALFTSGTIKKMKKRGIEYISYFQIDNPLVQVLDPFFLGFHILEGGKMSSKMCKKRDRREKVGHFCVCDGLNYVIEYSDMPEILLKKIELDGSLSFDAGSIAIHIFNCDFINELGEDNDVMLPFHRAEKKINFINKEGKKVIPNCPNAIKFETFVFDALPFSKKTTILEILRQDEFSPLKNANGEDSEKTCIDDQMKMFAGWLLSAGEKISLDKNKLPPFKIEISPLFASNEQDFIKKWQRLDKKFILEGEVYIE